MSEAGLSNTTQIHAHADRASSQRHHGLSPVRGAGLAVERYRPRPASVPGHTVPATTRKRHPLCRAEDVSLSMTWRSAWDCFQTLPTPWRSCSTSSVAGTLRDCTEATTRSAWVSPNGTRWGALSGVCAGLLGYPRGLIGGGFAKSWTFGRRVARHLLYAVRPERRRTRTVSAAIHRRRRRHDRGGWRARGGDRFPRRVRARGPAALGTASRMVLRQGSAGGGCLIDLGVHVIDLIRYVTGDDSTAVSALLNGRCGDVETDAQLLPRLRSGAIGSRRRRPGRTGTAEASGTGC